MNGIINFVQQFVSRSAEDYKNRHTGWKPVKWKFCVALEKAGYSAACEVVENSKDLVFVWNKEGEEEVKVRLSLAEQSAWLHYLERRRAAKEKGDEPTQLGE